MNKLMGIGVWVSMLASGAWGQTGSVNLEPPKIIVQGEAVVYVKPDKILLSFGIETWDKQDILTAKQKNTEIFRKALGVLHQLGIPDKDIQTDYLSIEPRYRDGYRREEFVGYFVRNTFVVTLREPEKLEQLITQMLQAGVPYIHGVDFQSSEFKKYREQARTLALQAAKEKAEKMAAALGQSIGPPLQIQEGQSPWYYYSGWSGWGFSRAQTMAQNVLQEIPASFEQPGETIALGKIAIRASVSVIFQLKQPEK
ncbi:MAG: SIMPL domain-containing protein [Thermoguttaceae bacterium]|nr:SIMPL domain-containing protein [Thermoguttaceae bacterium]MDW8037631.1 SIMPL domain-containing protein [Thermoguttaceae bacterium]